MTNKPKPKNPAQTGLTLSQVADILERKFDKSSLAASLAKIARQYNQLDTYANHLERTLLDLLGGDVQKYIQTVAPPEYRDEFLDKYYETLSKMTDKKGEAN